MSGRTFRRYRAALPLLLLLVAGSAPAQTPYQRDIRSRWDDPDEPRPRGGALLQREMLAAHNRARATVEMPPLAWSPTLAADAMVYARELARTGRFAHSPKASRPSPQGENLWMGTRDAFAYGEMAATWVNERRFYRPRAFPDISTTGNWADVGHYTQIIWRTTTQVGCALASNEEDDYLVCRYAPPGNVYGRAATSAP